MTLTQAIAFLEGRGYSITETGDRLWPYKATHPNGPDYSWQGNAAGLIRWVELIKESRRR